MRKFTIKELIQKANTKFIRFGIVGVMNTINFYLIYYILLLLSLPYMPSYIIAYGLSMIGSYFLNTFFVYKSTVSIKKFLQFPLVYVVQFLINLVAIYVCVEIFGIREELAPFLFLPITVLITFTLTKFIIEPKATQVDN